ncbi:MAG: 50S ribosomal protein L13 [Nitrospinae bacterium]|nr:50S ribosomal protein L13 [Nitrospinota bacterium]
MKPNARSYVAKPAQFPPAQRPWYIVDAAGKTLGRMSVKIANALRGKDRPTFTPHVDTGAFVIVVNAAKVKLTGKKMDRKIYHRHTGFVGGLRSATAREMIERKPEEVIREAVTGMLPKNKLNRAIIKKLKIYAGEAHPHEAQLPTPLEV